MLLPLGERGLREETRLHRHVVLDDDFFSANWLADGAESVAQDGNDGDLHGYSQYAETKLTRTLFRLEPIAPSPLKHLLGAMCRHSYR
jgi:hypothetical protein